MRAMLCGLCGCHLEATEDEQLCECAEDHIEQAHPATRVDHQMMRRIVATHAYKMGYVAPYAGTTGPDEEFGLEPY